MRILHIVFNQVDRGTYWRAFYFARGLAAHGHHVTLLATAPRERWRTRERLVEGVHVVEMPDLLSGALRSGWDPWAASRRVAWLGRRRFDIVHAFEARPTVLLPALRAQAQGARLVMDWCDWFGRGGSLEERPSALLRTVFGPIETFFEERFRTRASGTTVINRFLAQRARALGVPAERLWLLRNGANSEVPVREHWEARRALSLPPDAPILGYVGGIFARDAAFMAQAFKLLRRVKPNTCLLLIGHFNRDLERMLGDATGVMRTGPVTREALSLALGAVNIGWLPLLDSGANRGRWPMKLTDYMAAGRPVVATEVGDMAEVVLGCSVGEVTRVDPADFAARTLALLDEPERQRALGASARRAAEGVFSWGHLTEELIQHYQAVLGQGGAAWA